MGSPSEFSWKLPSSPDSKEYREALAFIEELKRKDPKQGMAWFAALAEVDFWFWQRRVMSLGKLEIRDPGHRRKGGLWVNEPWFFDRMREVQEDFDAGRTDVLYQFARFMFKSSAIQKGGALWFIAKDRTTTVAVFTHKLDQVGEAFGKDALKEIKTNAVLRAHWPQYRTLEEESGTRITVSRPPGIREPSLSFHGILGSAASGHFRIIFVDDAVTDKAASSPAIMAEVDSQISLLAPLAADDTQRFWIGTPWGEDDAIEKRRKKGTFFLGIRRYPGIVDGVAQLRSMAYWNNLRRTMREDHFSSQILLKLIPKGTVYFRPEWLRCYNGTPLEAGRGCRIHIKIDPAEGKRVGKRKSDLLVIEVEAFTFDRHRRSLDLWRERVGIAEAMDMLFGPLPGEEEQPDNLWKLREIGPRGLVGRWKRVDPDLTLWVENVGGSAFDQTIKREMRQRLIHDPASPTCTVRELRSNTPKEQRIAASQPDYRNGIMEFPFFALEGGFRGGYGHGSYTTEDTRDTLEQFLTDEYKQWTLSGEIANDDMLDLKAWPSQPGISMSYPDSPADPEVGGLRLESALASGGRGPASPSWRVA